METIFETYEIQAPISDRQIVWVTLPNGSYPTIDAARDALLERQKRNHKPMRIIRRSNEMVEYVEFIAKKDKQS